LRLPDKSAEGTILLKNDNIHYHSIQKITVGCFGITYDFIGGTGSGDVNEAYISFN
jgi:hypothetical protein